MKLNKKISALLSCILACSAINPSASAVTDYDEIDDTDDESGYYYGNSKEKEDSESDSIAILDIIKPILIVGTFYGGYKGFKAGQRYHARNMFTGHAWEIFMNSSDKKKIYDTVKEIKDFSTIRAYGDISTSIKNYNESLKTTEDYRNLEFNLLKLYIFRASDYFIKMMDGMSNNEEKDAYHSKIVKILDIFLYDAIAPVDLVSLKKCSDDAVDEMNKILNGKKTITNLSDNDKKSLEKNKKIIEFIDKIGLEDCLNLLHNCSNVQLDANDGKLEIKWLENSDNSLEPYKTLNFKDPDPNSDGHLLETSGISIQEGIISD